MRRLTMTFISLMLAAICGIAHAASPAPAERAPLGGGTVEIYERGGLRLHAYATNDPLDDECFLVESERGLVGIEMPALTADADAWRGYIESIGKPIEGLFVSAHPSAGRHVRALKLRVMATERAKSSIEEGTTFAATQRLSETIAGWEPSTVEVTDILSGGEITIAGITFDVIDDGDAYSIIMPQLNAYYTHMFGADTHSVITSPSHIDAMIGEARMCAEEGWSLILSGHHRPEGRAEVLAKINYLERVKEIIGETDSPGSFALAMREAFPEMKGSDFLDMSAGALYAPEIVQAAEEGRR